MKKILICLLFLSSTFTLTACSNFQFPGAYRIDIPQGNLLKEQDIAKLKIGMTKDQVQYVLGSPLSNNSLRPNSWNYVYSLKKGGKQIENKRLSLSFNEKGVLTNIQQ